MNKFIKAYHYADNKLSDEWCRIVANYIYFNGGCQNLLTGKKVDEIEEYATGNIDMKPFIRQFKSYNRRYSKLKGDKSLDGYAKMADIEDAFVALPLLPVKLNSAVHLIYKTLFDIQVRATDGLADEKRERDILFLKNRQKIQAIKQDIADQLSQGEVEVEGTKYSSTEFKEIPLDLDLNDSLQLKIFKDIIYKLQPEIAYENILQTIYELKKIDGVDLLEIYDDFKYGVRANDMLASAITGVPQVDYLHPMVCYAPKSYYPDFRDTSERYIMLYPTIEELHNMFGSEIGSEEAMYAILNSNKKDGGYFACNGLQAVDRNNWSMTRVELVRFEVISIDGVYYSENKSGNKMFVPKGTDGAKAMFGQNTYVFYWLPQTNHFFGKQKLGWAFRKQGEEAFSTFASNFYRSQKISAVEHCIGENKKAQIADIKLQHAIRKASESGKYIDLKYIRNATQGLLFDGKDIAEVTQDLIDLAIEENTMIGDTEGFDGKNEGQFLPVKEIQGGLRGEITGYLQVIVQANNNISRWTGINDELSGLNNNPDLLNGARKLNITYGMNAINYSYLAREKQYKNVFSVIAWMVKDAIEKGGDKKKFIQNLIGREKTDILKNLGTLKEHQFYINVNLGMRQDEINELNQSINILEQRGQFNRIERYILSQKRNPKEAYMLLAEIEDKANKKAAAQQQQSFVQQQQLQQGKLQGLAQIEQVKGEVKKDEIYTQADAATKLMGYAHELGLTEKQIEAALKNRLQADRLNNSLIKQNNQLDAKMREKEYDKTEPLTYNL